VSKDLLQQTVKMKNRGIFFNKKLHKIPRLKRMCWEKMKRNLSNYRSILSVMLATDSINLSVKKFSFLTDGIDQSEKEKQIFIEKIEPSA
jgi:hypothetical protein